MTLILDIDFNELISPEKIRMQSSNSLRIVRLDLTVDFAVTLDVDCERTGKKTITLSS